MDNPQDVPQGPYVPVASMANSVPMPDDANKVATSHAALTADTAIYNATRRKAYVSGTLKQDGYPYFSKANTAGGSGLVTFYITDTGTAGGTALFTNVYDNSAMVAPYGASGNYQASNITISGDKKSVTATISQITTILGLLTFNGTAANGLECRLAVWGD